MSSNEHDVGYGKPPRGSRFKKGQSGNPGGRPKGSGSFAAAIRAQGDALAPVLLDGKPAELWDVVARKLFIMAGKGDVKAMALILKTEIQRAKSEVEHPNAEVRQAMEFLKGLKDGVVEITLCLDEKPAASYCDECGKALMARIEEKKREMQDRTKH